MIKVCPKCGCFSSDNPQEYNIYKLFKNDPKLCVETFKDNILYDYCDKCSEEIITKIKNKNPNIKSYVSFYTLARVYFNFFKNKKELLNMCFTVLNYYKKVFNCYDLYNTILTVNKLNRNMTTKTSSLFEIFCFVYMEIYNMYKHTPRTDKFIKTNFWKLKWPDKDDIGIEDIVEMVSKVKRGK